MAGGPAVPVPRPNWTFRPWPESSLQQVPRAAAALIRVISRRWPPGLPIHLSIARIWTRVLGPARSRRSAADIIPRLEDGASSGTSKKELSLPTTTPGGASFVLATNLPPPPPPPSFAEARGSWAASGQTRAWPAGGDLACATVAISRSTRRAFWLGQWPSLIIIRYRANTASIVPAPGHEPRRYRNTYNNVDNLHLSGVHSLELIPPRSRTGKARFGRRLHQANLGLEVSEFLGIGQGGPGRWVSWLSLPRASRGCHDMAVRVAPGLSTPVLPYSPGLALGRVRASS